VHMPPLRTAALVWYNFWLVLCTLVAWLVCGLTLAPFGVWPPRVQRALGNFIIGCCRFCWRIPFTMTPWIRVQVRGLESQRKVGASGRPVLIIANHTSFLDTLLFIGYSNLRVVARVRTLANAHLWKLPLIGTLAKSIGHIPVHFKAANADNDFQTDKAQRQQMLDRLDDHVGNGGWICMYPEGQIHRGEGSAGSSQLQSFRIGGLGMALQYDMEMWAWTAKGNNDCWPRNGVGGLPASISASFVPIAPRGSRELLRELVPTHPAGAFGADDVKPVLPVLVAHAQQCMQAELDQLHAQGK